MLNRSTIDRIHHQSAPFLSVFSLTHIHQHTTPPPPPSSSHCRATLTAAHSAATPMLAAGVPSTIAALLLVVGLLCALWAVLRVLHAFRQAFDARELLFDDGSGGSGLGLGLGKPYRRRGVGGRWLGGVGHAGYRGVGAGGEFPLFPEDVHLQCSHWAETVR
jgi:hypothetical protein